MKKSYIFIYNPSLGTHEEVKKFIDSCSEITTWRFELANTYFFVSEKSAEELYELVAAHLGEGKGTFIITEYADNSQGLLSERSWYLLNNKRLPPRTKPIEND